MTPAQLADVWSMLDRDQLAGITRQGPEPVFATISGAHLYGFASRDSDIDLRGAFLLSAREMLGLRKVDETITIEQKVPIDLDWVAHDLRKFARMMVSHNGYVMEQLYSPLVVVTTPAHAELMALGRGCITRPTVRHYQGFARGRRKRVHEPDATVKHLLYAYRVLLAAWSAPLWQRVRERLLAHPSASKALDTKTESVVFELAKLVRLCAEANPNALEILFAAPEDWVHETDRWQKLYARRSLFLSRKVQQTYLGYGLSQLKRIQTHRSWLLHPPAAKPTRPAFGLPEQGTFSTDDRARLSALLEANPHGSSALPPAVLATLDAEKRYLAALKHWQSYETWKAQRNPARAELERRHGYDTKHASHLVRLMRMGLEVLKHQTLRVRRPDAEELRSIRDGALAYDDLLALAASLEAEMDCALAECRLPADVARGEIDALFFELAGG